MEIYNSETLKINIVEYYSVENYINFLLKINSYQFYGEHNFCISLNDLKEIISQLNKQYNEMNGEVKLVDYDSGSFICLQASKDYEVYIIGQLGAVWEDNVWSFKHNIDQTIFEMLINCFNKIIHG